MDRKTHCATFLVLWARIVFPALALRRGRKDGDGERVQGAGLWFRIVHAGKQEAMPPTASVFLEKETEQPLLGGQDGGGGRGETWGRSTEDLNQVLRLGTYFYNCSINCSLKSHKPAFPVC